MERSSRNVYNPNDFVEALSTAIKDNKKSGQVFRHVRLYANLSQYEFANQLSMVGDDPQIVEQQQISQIENERREPNPKDIVNYVKRTKDYALLGYYCKVYCGLDYIPHENRISSIKIDEIKENLTSGVRDLRGQIREFYKIILDAKIEGQDENEIFFKTMLSLKTISEAIYSLKCWAIKRQYFISDYSEVNIEVEGKYPYSLINTRNKRGDTQEKAAGLLECARTTYTILEKNYEDGYVSHTEKNLDKINRLATNYHEPELYEGMCRKSCPIGKFHQRPTKYGSLEDVSLGFVIMSNELRDENSFRNLWEILMDNMISEKERDEFSFLLKKLMEFSYYCDGLLYWGERYLTHRLRINITDMKIAEKGNFQSRSVDIPGIVEMSKKYLGYLENIGYAKNYIRETKKRICSIENNYKGCKNTLK